MEAQQHLKSQPIILHYYELGQAYARAEGHQLCCLSTEQSLVRVT